MKKQKDNQGQLAPLRDSIPLTSTPHIYLIYLTRRDGIELADLGLLKILFLIEQQGKGYLFMAEKVE